MTLAAHSKPSTPVLPQTPGPTPSVSAMPFVQHLAELRQRLIISVIAVLGATITTFLYAKPIIQALQRLVPNTVFVQLSPGEVFLASFKLSLFSGIGLALPVILYQVLRFVSPALKPEEKRYGFPLLILGLTLFASGVAFGYGVILPLMLGFLLDYGQGLAQNQLSIAFFLDFCTGFLFASGVIFQLPLLLLFSALVGLVSSLQLVTQWKWALIISFVVGAIITPSADPFSQMVMAGSLFGLYGFSILLIKLFKR